MEKHLRGKFQENRDAAHRGQHVLGGEELV